MQSVLKPEKVLVQCNFCEYKVTRKENLSNHIKLAHEMIEDHKCLDCGKVYINKRGLQDHIDIEHKGIRKKCQYDLVALVY